MKLQFRKVSASYPLVITSGLLVLILGALVLTGWYPQNVALIQVSQDFVPMQSNTALGFMLSGLGLIIVIRYGAGVGMGFGIFLMLMGLLTLGEYIFGVDIGIDQLLMQHEITTQTSHPGRMSPNAALCFFLAGAALFVLDKNTRENCWRSTLFAGVIGTLIFGLGIVALSGYMIGLETAYGWGELTRMALHTSLGFIFLGVAIISLAWNYSETDLLGFPFWIPLPVGIGIMTTMVSLWQAIEAYDTNLMKKYGDTGDLPFVNDLLLIFGIVFAAAVSITVYLTQASRSREIQVEAINYRLAIEADDRRIAEKLLQQSEESYRVMFENSEVSVWNEDMSELVKILDKLRLDGITDLRSYLQSNRQVVSEMAAMVKVLHVNEATLRLFKVSDEDDFLKRIDKTFGGDAIDVFIEELCAIWNRDKEFRSEAELRSLDGRKINAIISFRVPEEEDGFHSIPVSIIDITEQKRIEKALKQNESLLIETGRIAKVGGWDLDVETRELCWTEEIYRIYGLSSGSKPSLEEVINFCHPDDRTKLEAAFKNALEYGEPYDLETRFISAKGEQLWIRSICKPIFADGEIIRLTGTLQDISERRHSEEELMSQLSELHRWHRVIMEREGRDMELKAEVNTLLTKLGRPSRYASVEDNGESHD